MSDSFDDKDFMFDDDIASDDDFTLEDEWVEVSDIKGHKASFRHLATLRFGNKVYSILSAHRSEREAALMIVREDQTADGEEEHVIVGDEEEIEFVVGQFVAHVLSEHLTAEADDEEVFPDPCGYRHKPGEFCCCDDPVYLQ